MISIIIPTYNEARNIQELVEGIKQVLHEKYELIIVDDGSPDGTAQIAQGLAKKHPIKIIERGKKLGLASAVLDGFRLSIGELICVMDSDLSHPPEIIPFLVRGIREQSFDVVIGSRFTEGGGIVNWPKSRLINTSIAIFLTSFLTSVKDPMSGFFILRREVIDQVPLIPRGFKILLEILVKGRYTRVMEYPIIFKDRIYGNSKLNMKVYMEFVAQLIDLYSFKIFRCFTKKK